MGLVKNRKAENTGPRFFHVPLTGREKRLTGYILAARIYMYMYIS